MKPEDTAAAGFVGVRKRRGRVKGLGNTGGENLPPMPDMLRPEVNAAREVHKTRPASPGVRVYPDPKNPNGWMLDSPHRDLAAWEVQICEAFGTRSHALLWTFLDQLAGLCEQRWLPDAKGEGGRWMPSDMELNFIVATIHSERPETPLQSIMLAQMCATHMLQMRIAGDVLGRSWVDPSKAILTAKLANAFSGQVDAYLKLRGKIPKQQISVTYKREVHVHHHKHAHLNVNPPVEGGGEFFGQSHEANTISTDGNTPGQPAGGPALPGPDAAGNVVPMPRHEGKAQVLSPRRVKSGRAQR
jgi:hypothetical protein